MVVGANKHHDGHGGRSDSCTYRVGLEPKHEPEGGSARANRDDLSPDRKSRWAARGHAAGFDKSYRSGNEHAFPFLGGGFAG